VTAAGPAISEGVAAKLALHRVAQEHPELKGFAVVRTHYEPVSWTVQDSRGTMQFSESEERLPFFDGPAAEPVLPPGTSVGC
jgi:hypothetical protein